MKVLIALVGGLFATTLLVQSSPNSSNPKVAGQILQQSSGLPLRKVNVRLSSVGSHGESEGVEYASVTDGEGRFSFESVKPGAYRVAYDHPGFVDAEKRHHGNGMYLFVDAGREPAPLLFHMAPGAVITGKVLDVDGDPVPGVSVSVLPYPRNPHILGGAIGGAKGAITNELGEFRIGGLDPKRFLLVAHAIGQLIRAVELSRTNTARKPIYSTTYYPSTTDQPQSIPITLHAGDNVEADINLVLVLPFYVRGEVTGIPVGAEASVILRPMDDSSMADIQAWPADKDGKFEAREVLPGRYETLLVLDSGGKSHTVRGDQIIQVSGSDIDGLRITALPNGEIHGQFRMENGRAIDWSTLHVSFHSERNDMLMWARGMVTAGGHVFDSLYWDEIFPDADVQTNGMFEIKNMPADTYDLSVAFDENLSDYFIKSVSLAGHDVTDSGFTTTETSRLLDIVVSSKGASIEGIVTDEDNQPAPYVEVITIPDPVRRQRRDLFKEATTDRQGHFRIRGLPPGEYQIMALDEDLDEDPNDPDFVRSHESLGQSVSIQESEHKNMNLKLVLSAE